MSVRTLSTPLLDDIAAAYVSYNANHTGMAVVSPSNSISTFSRDGHSRDWIHESTWDACESITCIAWAPTEYGNLFATATATGTVSFWFQSTTPNKEWTRRAHIRQPPSSSRPATQIAFAPPSFCQHHSNDTGAVAAISFIDGFVRLYSSATPLDCSQWDPHSEFQVANKEYGGCTCLCWKEKINCDDGDDGDGDGDDNNDNVPPLLVVGTSSGACQLWTYSHRILSWHLVHPSLAAAVGSSSSSGNSRITSVAWAPLLGGRRYELLAVASGTQVTLFSLTGPLDALRVEVVATLSHDDPVWHVEFNAMATWLAASTEAGQVCLWRPDLSGEWLCLNTIVSESLE